MLTLIHRLGKNGKYYTALSHKGSGNLDFDKVKIHLALAIASEQARKLSEHYNSNTPLSLLTLEQEWCIDITI